MTRSVVILGAGAFAREVLDVFEACREAGSHDEVAGFLVDSIYGQPGDLVNGKPILGDLTWLRSHPDVQAVCAVGNPADRRRIVERAMREGVAFCSVIHPRAVITKRIDFGKGVIVTAGVVLTNQIVIGDHVILNLACTIGHDVRIANFATVAPGANLSGNVIVGTGAFVGTGACVLEKTRIGQWSVVGAGAAVIRDVPPNTTVIGNPARVLLTRPEGWQLIDDSS